MPHVLWIVLLLAGTAVLLMADHATGSSSPPRLVPLIAHRGESHLAPENTLAAFRLAWQSDADACECDIHLTRDGQVIVCHDADTFRTTGGRKDRPGTGQKLVIRDSTADALRRLDVGGFKDERYRGERMPLLSECLESMPAGKVFFVEIKSGTDVVPAAADVIRRSGRGPGEVVLISFHADALAQSKQLLPGYAHYLLASAVEEKQDTRAGWQYRRGGEKHWVATIDELLAAARAANADGLNLQNKTPPLDRPVFEKARSARMPVFVWTEDDPAAARRWIDLGAAGITTNRAAWLKQRLLAVE